MTAALLYNSDSMVIIGVFITLFTCSICIESCSDVHVFMF